MDPITKSTKKRASTTGDGCATNGRADIGESDWILENLDMKIIDEYYNGLHYPDKELQKAVEIYRAK